MAEGKRKKTPSRVKYEVKRPTFSFRIYDGLEARIQKVKKAEGISNTNLVEAAVGLFEVKGKKEEEIRQQAYDEGWQKGINSTWDLLAVTYPCAKCGKEITVDTKEEKKAIRKFIIDSGWSHSDCSHP